MTTGSTGSNSRMRFSSSMPLMPGGRDVAKYHVRLHAGEQLERLLSGARDRRLVAVVREVSLGGSRQGVFVIEDQHSGSAHAPFATGSQIRTVVPRGTTLAISRRPPASST